MFAHRKGSVYKTGYGGAGGKEVAFSWGPGSNEGQTRVGYGDFEAAKQGEIEWHRPKCKCAVNKRRGPL